MNNFIFKSPRRLVKNSSIDIGDLMHKLNQMQLQLRQLRGDNHEISLKLEKLLIDKHLQMQVDEYFTEDGVTSPQTEQETPDDGSHNRDN